MISLQTFPCEGREKLFTTTDRCVYVLGLDHVMVRKGIAKKYKFGVGKEGEGGQAEAADYLKDRTDSLSFAAH